MAGLFNSTVCLGGGVDKYQNDKILDHRNAVQKYIFNLDTHELNYLFYQLKKMQTGKCLDFLPFYLFFF